MKFLAVDLNSVFRRQWEAAEGKDFGTARARAVSAIQGAFAGYDRLVVCRDAPPSFRRAIFAGYKANRTDPGEAFREQLKLTIQDLRELGASIWASPSLGQHEGRELYGEADDVIASFALWYQEHCAMQDPPWSLRIMTGDCDLWALVDDQLGIDVLTLDGKVIGVDAVVERFGVDPVWIPEVKALSGDDSDNFKGFKSIGDGTAAAILRSGVELGPEDRSAADVVLRAVLADADPGVPLKSNQIASLKEGGAALLMLGRQLAYLRPTLRTVDGQPAPLDFSAVLAEPTFAKRRRPKDPDPDAKDSPPASAPSQDATATAQPTAALAVHAGDAAALARPADLPFAPQLNKMMRFAGEMYDSGVFRNTLRNSAACLMVCEYARSFGVPAVILAQHTVDIKGKMSFGAQVIMSIILKHPSTKRFRFTGDLKSASVQRVKYWRVYPDGEDEQGVYEYTIEDARRAGLLDGKHSEQWTKAPHVMLAWAAARECARKVWPEVTVGIYGRDELAEGGMVDNPGELPGEMIQED